MPTGDTETTKNGSTKGCQMKALSLEDSLSPKRKCSYSSKIAAESEGSCLEQFKAGFAH